MQSLSRIVVPHRVAILPAPGRCFLAAMLVALGACHKDKPEPIDPNEGKAHPGALVGVWRTADASLDAVHSTCGQCAEKVPSQGYLRFAVSEQTAPRVFGYAFNGQELRKGSDGLEALTDCAGTGARDRIHVMSSQETGLVGTLSRETGSGCGEPFEAKCACVYKLSAEKISDSDEALPEPVAPVPAKDAAPVAPRKT